MSQRFIVCRTDRLGDVLLSLPALSYLRQTFPKAKIDFLVKRAPLEAIAPMLSEWNIQPVPFPNDDKLAGYDAALLLFDEPGLAFRLMRSGCRVRVGNRSRFSSFLFLNRGIRQRRSKASENEAEYGLQLARRFVEVVSGNAGELSWRPVVIPGDAGPAKEAEALLSRMGLESKRFVLVHPGMGGSALNLSPKKYAELIGMIREHLDLPIILSEGPHPTDVEWVAQICRLLPDPKVIRHLAMPVFREVLRKANLVVAPSTGPLHLAHCVGTATFGIFSPVRAHHPSRWAPFGGGGRSLWGVPTVDCPAIKACLGERCSHFPCMESTEWGGLLLNGGDDLTT